MPRPSWVAVVLLATTAVPAFAEDNRPPAPPRPPSARGDKRVVVTVPANEFTPHADVAKTIWMNRCVGGCEVTSSSTDDARENKSHIPMNGGQCSAGWPTCTISEFATADNKTGSSGKCKGGTSAGVNCTEANGATVCMGGGTCYTADDEWSLVMKCMKEVYSPYDVNITDQKPADGESYTMAIVAGHSDEIGWQGALGVAPVANDCSAKNNVIAFAFANDHPATERVNNLCWTAAQETAHAFGLDHEFEFKDGTSACTDPMTYRFDNTDGSMCGGQKFFRNKDALCGEMETRQCACSGVQNSHEKIKAAFGDGQTLIDPPTVAVTSPMPSSTISNGAIVTVQAGSQRGVDKVALILNGYKWVEVPGAKFRALGQPNPSEYSIAIPNAVPNSIIDIVVEASDDLGAATTSTTLTVTKGAPCTSASTCAEGQKCEAGKCFWDAPLGEIGDDCTYAQYCKSGVCLETSEGQYCSQNCIVGDPEGCPSDYHCQVTGTGGACIPTESVGCCSVGGGPTQIWFHLGLSGVILGFMIRRRRKR